MVSVLAPILTCVSDVQPENALLYTAVTLSGRETEVSAVQPAKALSPTELTPSGIVTSVSPVQPLNIYCGTLSMTPRDTSPSAVQP